MGSKKSRFLLVVFVLLLVGSLPILLRIAPAAARPDAMPTLDVQAWAFLPFISSRLGETMATATSTPTATLDASPPPDSTPTSTNTPTSTSTATPTNTAVPEANINLWYGSTQKFGGKGNPQQWVNVLGNFPDSSASSTLSYQVNGGADKYLAIGADGQRLHEKGDFNVEIDYASLKAGSNNVVIKVNDGGHISQKAVAVNYTAGRTWPSNYDAVWSSSADIQNIAQVVDGRWQLDGNSVKIDANNWGFNRLLAIGDETWRDYEVTVPVTVYGLDPAGFQGVSNGPAVGMILRWLGHSNKGGEQPNADWDRMGAIGWYRWAPDLTESLELRGYDWSRGRSFNRVLELNQPYIFKMSVQSVPGQPAYYRLKFWPAGQQEPGEWALQGSANGNAAGTGSLLLVAHHVHARFGQVTVRNLETLRLDVDVNVDGEGSVQLQPDQADYGYAERIKVFALPDYGYEFDRWTGDYTGTNNPADFLIFKDMGMTAHFKAKAPTTLTIHTEGQGSVSKNPDKSEYGWGETVTLTAVPGDGQVFLQWTGDVEGVQNPTSLVMDGDKVVTALFEPASAVSPKSDDFSGGELDTSIWQLINPAGDAEFGIDENRAKFMIPAGSTHNMWSDNADALRIMQPTDDQNFEIKVKFESIPDQKYQMEGLLIQQDAANWLRFDFYHNGSTLQAYAASNSSGTASSVKFAIVDPGSASNLYIKVRRIGDQWTYSYSLNNNDWTTFVVFVRAMEVTSSGLFVGNSAQSPGLEPAFTAYADFFFNTAAPIEPEN